MSAPASITCPVCGMTSHHPMDIVEGYCGNCHAWTSDPKLHDLGDVHLAVLRAVAATLRQVARWEGVSGREMREIADEVEADDFVKTCPVCQEVSCDQDCPLAPVRRYYRG